MGTDCPFAVLGLLPTASPDEIKRAYRHRARCSHPDTAEHGGDRAEFDRVMRAYAQLRIVVPTLRPATNDPAARRDPYSMLMRLLRDADQIDLRVPVAPVKTPARRSRAEVPPRSAAAFASVLAVAHERWAS